MATAMSNPKALGVEQRWFPFTDERRAELREHLTAAGCSRRQTAGILEFVALQFAGDPSAFNSATRARYRKILAGLLGIDPGSRQRPGLPLGFDPDAEPVTTDGTPIIYELGSYVSPVLLAA